MHRHTLALGAAFIGLGLALALGAMPWCLTCDRPGSVTEAVSEHPERKLGQHRAVDAVSLDASQGAPVAVGSHVAELVPHDASPDGRALAWADVWQRLAAVGREYDYWFDAGLGPEQVSIRFLPDGTMLTRVSNRPLDEPPIAPGVLRAWDLYERDPAASIAVGQVSSETSDITEHCTDAFLDRVHLESDVDWTYVWRVRSVSGRSRVLDIEIRDEWWPAAFDARDRACYLDAFKLINAQEFVTDSHDFDYRIETGIYFATDSR